MTLSSGYMGKPTPFKIRYTTALLRSELVVHTHCHDSRERVDLISSTAARLAARPHRELWLASTSKPKRAAASSEGSRRGAGDTDTCFPCRKAARGEGDPGARAGRRRYGRPPEKKQRGTPPPARRGARPTSWRKSREERSRGDLSLSLDGTGGGAGRGLLR
jgi:hypothetical protein